MYSSARGRACKFRCEVYCNAMILQWNGECVVVVVIARMEFMTRVQAWLSFEWNCRWKDILAHITLSPKCNDKTYLRWIFYVLNTLEWFDLLWLHSSEFLRENGWLTSQLTQEVLFTGGECCENGRSMTDWHLARLMGAIPIAMTFGGTNLKHVILSSCSNRTIYLCDCEFSISFFHKPSISVRGLRLLLQVKISNQVTLRGHMTRNSFSLDLGPDLVIRLSISTAWILGIPLPPMILSLLMLWSSDELINPSTCYFSSLLLVAVVYVFIFVACLLDSFSVVWTFECMRECGFFFVLVSIFVISWDGVSRLRCLCALLAGLISLLTCFILFGN